MKLDFSDDRLVTSSKILERVSEYVIFRYYLGVDFNLGERFESPLRADNTPSFNIFRGSDNRLRFKDLSRGGIHGNCFTFVMCKFNLTYGQALDKIYSDFKLNEPNGEYEIVSRYPCDDSGDCINISNSDGNLQEQKVSIAIKKQPFTYHDFVYWKGYGIDIQTLIKYNVSSAKYVYVNRQLVVEYSAANPVYAYEFDTRIKVYKPKEQNKKYKWFANIVAGDYQGYKQLPETGPLVIITKSLKDVMVLDTLGYCAVAPHSESYSLDKSFIDDLCSRFDNVVVLYDNDAPGIDSARRVYEVHGILSVTVPNEPGIKDISDYRRQHGRELSLVLLRKIIYG